MIDVDSGNDPLDNLAEEFARRWRNGERPSVEEYAERYPRWADEIRAVLPGVVLMEQLKPSREENGPSEPAPGPDQPPEQLGEYRIIREIGRGGMGVVYEAEQEPLGRRVALKVLPRHLLANENMRSRFRRESNAAARLHHTNIVPVFGVGESDQQCFYVMQLIDGSGLDQVIRAAAVTPESTPPAAAYHRTEIEDRGSRIESQAMRIDAANTAIVPRDNAKPIGNPQSALSFRTAAQIGIQVAEALAYAHTQGILHRDIKPSNLLLDSRGAVWVTDFGVAKLVEEADLTGSGEFVGTLKYMPPERFAGQSDACGDVYSLGVTLYELITLRPAFPDTTPQHLIQLITQEVPSRPRKLNPAVPTDLETIVLKAAARDPAHRYQTPRELADDLRRFLDDRPILARRAGPVEQARRWCRRNPALAATTAAAFLLMVAITLVSVIAYVKTAAANRATATANRDMETALAAEKAQRQQAERTSTLALEALNRTYDRFAPTRLVVTPPALDDEGVELPPQPAALPPEAIPLLEDLLRTYEQIARSAGEFPNLQAQAAEANHHIGDIRQRLGRFEDAAAAYRTAIDLYARLSPDVTGDAVRIKLARTCNELGRTLRTLRQLDEAERMHQRAIETLTAVPREFADRPECRYELARSYYTLGQRDMSLSPRGLGGSRPPGEPGRGPPRPDRPPPGERGRGPGRGGPPGPPPEPDGEHPTQRAAALLEQLVGEFPTVPEYRHLLACSYRDMPPSVFGRGPQSRNPNTDRAVELLRKLIADFPKIPDYRFDLCETLGRPGPPGRPWDQDDSTARGRLEEAVTLSAELAAQYPNVPEYTAAHARYLGLVGMRAFEAGKLDEAEKPYRRAVVLQSHLVKRYPEVLAYAYWLSLLERSLGQVLSDRGELKEARVRLESALGRVEAMRKKDPRLEAVRPFLGSAYRDLAQVLTRSGETVLAAETLRKAASFGREGGPGPPGPRERGNSRP